MNLGAANIVELEKRVDMAARLVQVGYTPRAAAQVVGLPEIEHTGLPTVQLQNATQAAESPADIADEYPVD